MKGTVAEVLAMSKDYFRSLPQERHIPYFRQTLENVVGDAEVIASLKPN